jgi:hypothetical protein
MTKLTKTQQKKMMTDMIHLEQKLHGGEMLSNEEHQQLENLHAMHGAGFFDDVKKWIFDNFNPIGRAISYGKKVVAKNM